MAIASWWCGKCQLVVPLDHFETCTYCHPDFAAAILADRESQADRTGVRVSMSSACPRKAAIERACDIAVDPLSYLAAMRGTAWHSVMEAGAGQEDRVKSLTPNYIGAEIAVAGTIANIPITGKIDRVLLRDGPCYRCGRTKVDPEMEGPCGECEGTGSRIHLIGQDHKTGKDARAVFIKGGKAYGKQVAGQGAPVEYKVQLSLYAELYRQQFGRAWDSAEIWWTFSAEHWCESVGIMSVGECLAHRPYDCDYTVEQLLIQAQAAAGGVTVWQELPLVGKSIKFGRQSGCDYCSVRGACWEQNQGAPF